MRVYVFFCEIIVTRYIFSAITYGAWSLTIVGVTIFYFISRLDQQIWGSEDEEDLDEEQEGKKDKEERGKGESTGEKEMGAKEEEQGTDDGADGKDRKKKKDINEMDDPEVDDDHVSNLFIFTSSPCSRRHRESISICIPFLFST